MMRRLLELATAPLVERHEGGAADAAVVLGAPLRPDGSLTEVLEERVAAAVELWRAGRVPLVVMTGGRTRGAAIAEAEAMAAAARARGVPPEALLVETAARYTAENAKNVAALLLPARRRVWVVTQPFHLRRSMLWFRRVGFEPLGLYLADSVQFRRPLAGLRWVLREVPAWLRDRFIATT
ncbi:MAG TPA: YdcF family protein [Haliangiales bacterium]|nr:YdcF family protein [Haliangiales bacterium]